MNCSFTMIYPDEFQKLFNDGVVLFEKQLNGKELLTCRDLYSQWFRTIPEEFLRNSKTHVIKDYFNGHNAFSWYVRCLFNVNIIFTEYWGLQDLVVSYERSIRYENLKKDVPMYTNWVHDARYGTRSGLRAYVVITAPPDTAFVHLPGRWGKKNGAGKMKADRSEGTYTFVKAGDVVVFSASLVSCLSFGYGVTVIQPVSYFPRNKITPNIAYRRFNMYLGNEISTHACYNPVALEKGNHERENVPEPLDQFLDLIYVDHEVRNTMI